MTRILSLIFTTLAGCVLFADEKIPAGFEVQVLEPTGGRILRPEGWFYNEGHGKKSWMWTITREDPGLGGSYDTGVRIQAIVDVEGRSGKSPEVLVREYITQKSKVADIVHKTCEAEDQGMFSRICIEVTEGEYRILYSALWGNDMDIAVFTTAGSKVAEWDENVKFFDEMSAFELIDMTRFPDGVSDQNEKPDGDGKEGFAVVGLLLYQSDEIMEARVSSVKDFGAYVEEVQRVCEVFFAKATIPESLNVVIAVRPDKTSKVWLISSVKPDSLKGREELIGQLETVPPFTPAGGPVAFSLIATIAGGDGNALSQPPADGMPALPAEWSEALGKKQGAVVLPDGILDDVWPVKE